MNIFTFFSILEKQKEIKSINYSDTGIIIYLPSFEKVLLPLHPKKLISKYFWIEIHGQKSQEVMNFLKVFLTLEKQLQINEKDFENFHTSLKIDYKIFHTVWDTFIIEFPDCNNRCYFCETHSEARIRKWFSFENIVNTYETLKTEQVINTIDFFWWEPTIHRDFLTFVEYFSKKWHTLYLATHGRNFKNKEFLESIRWKFKEIRISFHSIVQEEFERVTGVKWSYKETLDGIQNLYQAWFDNVVVNIVVTKNNFHQVTQTIQELYKINPLLTIKISGLIFSKNETLEDIESSYPGIEKMYQLIHQEVIPTFKNLGIKKGEFEKIPLCLLEKESSNYAYLPETYRNQSYDNICQKCPKKEVCTILPQIQLDSINKNPQEKIFFENLKKRFITENKITTS
jgi:MoaA/NifB/PqqE/SkfB family radical SAM enzyme